MSIHSTYPKQQPWTWSH